jgi:hypothetical protein
MSDQRVQVLRFGPFELPALASLHPRGLSV